MDISSSLVKVLAIVLCLKLFNFVLQKLLGDDPLKPMTKEEQEQYKEDYIKNYKPRPL